MMFFLFFFFLVVFIYLLFQEEEEEGQVYTLEGAGRLVQQQFFSEWAPGWRLGAAARPHLGRSTRGRAGPASFLSLSRHERDDDDDDQPQSERLNLHIIPIIPNILFVASIHRYSISSLLLLLLLLVITRFSFFLFSFLIFLFPCGGAVAAAVLLLSFFK
jgi:hypothetical protein